MRIPIQPLSPPSPGEQWSVKVRTSPVCRRQVPLEARLSYPVPGEGVLHYFHSLLVASRTRTRLLTRLEARLPGLEVVEFRKAAEGGELFPGLPNEVPGRPAPYDGATEEAFFAVLPEVVRRYPNEPAGVLGPQFREALEVLAGPVLLPYYLALNPRFFEWCG
jgi:hypothetical protein